MRCGWRLLALLAQKYVLYWYKSTAHVLTAEAVRGDDGRGAPRGGARAEEEEEGAARESQDQQEGAVTAKDVSTPCATPFATPKP
jgi:hypothetical protein